MTSCTLRSKVLLTSAAALLFSAASLFAQTPSFVSFDAPHAGTGVGQGTVAASINSNGVIAGYYIDSSDTSHGFVRDASGTITEFDPTNMTQTTVQSINKLGQITGFAKTSHGNTQGFLRKVNGNFVHIAVPGSTFTQPWRINDNGVIAGLYSDGGIIHGFTFAAGVYTTFDDPDAALSAGTGTRATAIDVGNVVVGYYDDKSTGIPRFFVRDPAGNFTNFDAVPGGSSGVFPVAINQGGQIAGTYYNLPDGVSHSFIRDALGTITTFVVSGATGTRAVDMNDSGIIVGQWTDNSFNTQGFLRTSSGVITTFSAPVPNGATFPFAINNSGRITGSYYNPSGVGFHGFVR